LKLKFKKRVWIFGILTVVALTAVEIGNGQLASWAHVKVRIVSMIMRWMILIVWGGSFIALLTGTRRAAPPRKNQ
jgi:hypothetical protein